MKFRNDIQGLRAIAFILVYIFHLNPRWLPGGYIGVDMFFVISGYLITSIILHQKEKGTFSLLTFYEKRIKRIVPAYYVAIIFIAIAGCYFYLQSDTPRLRSGLYRSLAFLSNQFFATGESYFGTRLSENPLLHTWSLSIEMQFYLILPVLLILLRNKWLPYVIGVLLVILTGYSTYNLYYTNNFSATYFSLLSRIPEFFVGVLLSVLFLKKKPLPKDISIIVSFLGLLGIVLTAFLINENTPFPGVIALIPCVSTGLLLISGENLIGKLLSSKPMVYIGELSYSLYLWHWPIMAYLRYSNSFHTAFSAKEIFVISILTFVCAWLSYVYVEKIFRNQTNRVFALSFTPVVLLGAFLTIQLPKINFNGHIATEFTKTVFGQNSHAMDNVEVFGKLASETKSIALIGDSHAHVLKSFMDYLGKKHNFSFKTITASAFPALEGMREEDFTNERLPQFLASRALVKTTSELINGSKIIFINSVGFHRVPSLGNALEDLAKTCQERNQQLVIFTTVPIYGVSPLRINKRVRKNNRSGYSQDPIDNEENKNIILKIVEKYENVHTYDLSRSKVFDDGPFYQDTILYYDHSHINIYGSLVLAREEEEEFMILFNSLLHKME